MPGRHPKDEPSQQEPPEEQPETGSSSEPREPSERQGGPILPPPDLGFMMRGGDKPRSPDDSVLNQENTTALARQFTREIERQFAADQKAAPADSWLHKCQLLIFPYPTETITRGDREIFQMTIEMFIDAVDPSFSNADEQAALAYLQQQIDQRKPKLEDAPNNNFVIDAQAFVSRGQQ